MRKVINNKKGITLPEVLTVVVIVVMVTVISMPAVDVFFDSLASQGSAEAMINAALSSARAMATSEHKYVGIRFQKIYDDENIDRPELIDQYMIFIVYDPEIPQSVQGNLGCKAVEGLKPIKLPENIGVMDLYYGSDDDREIDDDLVNADLFIDASTFSILFSSSGKLVTHTHKAQRRVDNDYDDIFNTLSNVENDIGMFIQDVDSVQPVNELSRRQFLIYDRKEFRRAYDNGRPFSDYLERLALRPLYINPYTGTIISQGQ